MLFTLMSEHTSLSEGLLPQNLSGIDARTHQCPLLLHRFLPYTGIHLRTLHQSLLPCIIRQLPNFIPLNQQQVIANLSQSAPPLPSLLQTLRPSGMRSMHVEKT